MQITPTALPGVLVLTPAVHTDARGSFHEWYSGAAFAEAVGHPLGLAQANASVSHRGVVRGVHFADVPPGQAKHVTCLAGAVLDVAVDLRVGSPTFGRWHAERLDATDRRALYLPEGLGHAFCALTDEATVVYLCSEPYRPAAEHGVHPLDPALGLPWPDDVDLVLSDKDAEAPSLAEARAAGTLPSYDACLAHTAALAPAAPAAPVSHDLQ